MDYTEGTPCRVVGDYILGRRIGSGSFAVVWQAWHRQRGIEVAIKEIDKKQLSSKVNESLFKEITILRQIRHQNIIRLHEAMEIGDRIYLVLEYCPGSDLAAYIQRFGRVSVAIARHFMRQLASGLQVLRENNLIHRDLKPQNLLLSSKEEAPILKIGDFGFARYLMPQGLAETLCGSPLYMAPEIIQSQKYDAKADLWSVGAILFQLVTGKPPFEGNSHFQLFQNILASNELQFPQDVKGELPMDCIDLCKSLLRQNPVERLSFEEFFNHKFMVEPRPTVGTSFNSPLQGSIALIEQGKGLTDDESFVTSDKGTQLNSDESILSQKKPLLRKDHDSEASSSITKESTPEYRLTATSNSLRKSIDGDSSNLTDQESMKMESAERGLSSMSMLKVADSLEHIEHDYVLVHSNFTSMETLSSSLEASVQDTSATRHSDCPKTTGKGIVAPVQMRELAVSSVCGVESLGSHGSAPLVSSQASAEIVDIQRSASLHPSTRLRFLRQYVHALSELAREKLNAGLHLESFSVELVALAVWKEALLVCSSWVASSAGGDSVSSSASECPPGHESSSSSINMVEGVDFNNPASVCAWAEKGFIVACNRAESNFFHNMDGSVEMPDAMEIIYQAALAAGRDGAVDQLMGDCSRAAASYKKARLLLSFILEEATLLPLNPSFSLSASDQQRIHRYIVSLKAHQSQSEMMPPTF